MTAKLPREQKQGISQAEIIMVVPLYNHADTIASVVEKGLAAGWEVLVVDDGSSDGGLEQVKNIKCHGLQLSENRGKGAALMAAALRAQELGFRGMLAVDADGQHDPADAINLANIASQQWPVLVIGDRIMDKDSAPAVSLFGRSFSNFWVRLETGLVLPDTQSGMRLYPVAELLEMHLVKLRYDFEIEVLVKMAWAKIPVKSVPISVHYPPNDERISHFHKFTDNVRLSLLHTMLVLRQLLPWPHANETWLSILKPDKVSIKHPIRTLKKLLREYSSPGWLASAVWMGIFLGALPLLAIHTMVIILVCHRLHLNKMAAVAASQFCAPPVMPMLCIQVGYFFQHGSWLTNFTSKTWFNEAHVRILDWFLGSLVVGPFFGFVGAGIIYVSSKKIQNLKGAKAK